MAKTKHVLNVEPRNANGSAEAKRLRKAGKIPAVIYSRDTEAVSVSVNKREWSILARHEINLISLQKDGKEILALLKEVQHDFIRNEAMHLDFMAVHKDQVISAHVAVHPGVAAPAGVALGGILEQNLHEIEVVCTPDNLPETIEVNVSAMKIGDQINVGQLPLPEGVKAATSHDIPVFVIIDPNAAEDEAPASEEGLSQPEVIGEKERQEKAAAEAEAKKK